MFWKSCCLASGCALLVASVLAALPQHAAAQDAAKPVVVKLRLLMGWRLVSPAQMAGYHTAQFSYQVAIHGDKRAVELATREDMPGYAYRNSSNTLGETWRVLPGNKIRGTWQMGNYTKFATVWISDRGCRLAYDSRLNRGERYYADTVNGVKYEYEKPRVLEADCTLAKG